MPTISGERVAELFVEVADTLVDDFDLNEFLHKVTADSSTLASATAAGVLLADPQGKLQLMAASTSEAWLLELFQVQSVEGPCQDCFRLGSAVVNADLATAGGKWPQFAPVAVEAGFRSVHAFPLRLRQEVIGALNLFSADTGRLEPEDARVVQALADVVTIGLLQERAIRQAETVTEQLQTALNSRITIEQAKGILAQIHSITVDEAFQLLRRWCRSHQQRLSEVAHGIATEPARYPELTAPRDSDQAAAAARPTPGTKPTPRPPGRP